MERISGSYPEGSGSNPGAASAYLYGPWMVLYEIRLRRYIRVRRIRVLPVWAHRRSSDLNLGEGEEGAGEEGFGGTESDGFYERRVGEMEGRRKSDAHCQLPKEVGGEKESTETESF
eukprot:SAG11_NODE_4561_length_1850_cov_6.817247_1_plen_116_part_10